ncbi:TolC family outer membrane protein [Candidiatus Paracoxiella cheracis]|uniref:TolC family outer membrane protein n=1 Tax=Candidiatus Paracoxiella cheracis TaxID=3405120 RepID=UPI003BF51F93
MNKKILACLSALASTVIAMPTYAADLMQVYKQAFFSDPSFKKAQADWLSAKQNLPIAMSGNGSAGSGLFPYLDVSGGINRTYQKQTVGASINSDGYVNGNNYLLTLTQPIFNYQTWKSISSARYSVKAATATYLAAAQDLMYRVAQAYFNVLSANDQLRFTIAQKKAFLRQLITAEQKFKVGLIAVTGVYDAQASYDNAVATEIKDRNNLANMLENLRAITGVQYRSLKGLRTNIPLVIPKPGSIEQWVRVADQQNYMIKSDLYSMLAAHETIKVNEAARYPTITGQASYGAITQGTISGLNIAAPGAGGGVSNTVTTTGILGVNVNFPVFQGGYVSETTKQAEYNYLSASDQLEFQHRNVINQTRQAFLGVQSGISQIQADVQAIKSARNKLEATQAGYVVGTRTMVDVLNAVTSLTQAQQTWANDRYNYVISIITLEQQAGTLSPDDLARINAWLSSTEIFHPEEKVHVSRYSKSPLPSPSAFANPPTGGQPTRIFHQPLTSRKTTTGIPSVPKAPKTPTTSMKPKIPSGQQRTAKTSTLSKKAQAQTYYYAIQIYADHHLTKAREFVARQRLKAHMQIIFTRYHNTEWYKVIYGHYVTKAEAEKALKQMPLELKKYKPWIIRVPKVTRNLKERTEQPAKPTEPMTLPKPSSDKQSILLKQALDQHSDRVTSFRLDQQANNVVLPKSDK